LLLCFHRCWSPTDHHSKDSISQWDPTADNRSKSVARVTISFGNISLRNLDTKL
jgi:hypothetical protein